MSLAVTILHGPIRSGKTTLLGSWAKDRRDLAGVLQPEGAEGRLFLDLATGDAEALEPVHKGEPVIAVGRYRFRAQAFDWANERLQAAAHACKVATLIIDEIGPLELTGQGLFAGLEAVLARPQGEVILVVRSPLVGAVRDAFGLGHARIVAATDWPQAAQGTMSAP